MVRRVSFSVSGARPGEKHASSADAFHTPVYDITARDTFESLSSWITELDTFAGSGTGARDVVRMIVGNKVDKEFSRVVSTAEGEQFAASQNPPWMFMECSAKKGGEDVIGEDGLFGKVVDKVGVRVCLVLRV